MGLRLIYCYMLHVMLYSPHQTRDVMSYSSHKLRAVQLYPTHHLMSTEVGLPPNIKLYSLNMGIAQKGVGGSGLAQIVWSTFFY